MTLSETIKGIKQGEFKFDKLKAELRILEGLLEGATIVKPQNAEAEERLQYEIQNAGQRVPVKSGCSTIGRLIPDYQTVNTESIKELIQSINTIL